MTAHDEVRVVLDAHRVFADEVRRAQAEGNSYLIESRFLQTYDALEKAVEENKAQAKRIEALEPFAEAAAEEATTGPEWAEKARTALAQGDKDDHRSR